MGRVKKMTKEQRQARTEKREARRKLRHAKRIVERLARTQRWLDKNDVFGKAEWLDWDKTQETGDLTFIVEPTEFQAYFEKRRPELDMSDEAAKAYLDKMLATLETGDGEVPSYSTHRITIMEYPEDVEAHAGAGNEEPDSSDELGTE